MLRLLWAKLGYRMLTLISLEQVVRYSTKPDRCPLLSGCRTKLGLPRLAAHTVLDTTLLATLLGPSLFVVISVVNRRVVWITLGWLLQPMVTPRATLAPEVELFLSLPTSPRSPGLSVVWLLRNPTWTPWLPQPKFPSRHLLNSPTTVSILLRGCP